MELQRQLRAERKPERPFNSARFGTLQRKCARGGPGPSGGECKECKKKQMTLRRHPAGQATPATVPPIVYDVLRSPGQPLDSETRAFFEPRFGHDFGKVRVHSDARAGESARAVNALAYTVGQDIAFDNGQYAPETMEGRRLLAHELAHVVQQRSTAAGTPDRILPSSDRSEEEACRAGDMLVRDAIETSGPGAESSIIPFRPQQLPSEPTTCAIQGANAGHLPKQVQAWVVQRQEASTDAGPAANGDGDGARVVLGSLVSPSIDGPITFSPWSLHGAPAIAVYSPLFRVYGSAVLDSTKAANDQYELGFMQAVTASTLTAVYKDQSGTPSQTLQITEGTLPVRDSLPGSRPWSKPGDVISFNDKNYSTVTEDRPRNLLPWQTPDKKAALSYCDGLDSYSTWLVLREKATGSLGFLNWVTWSVDWGCSFDPARQTGTSMGKGGELVGSGDGEGAVTPLTGDPIANDVIVLNWGGPP
jgi:hypothetical protein